MTQPEVLNRSIAVTAVIMAVRRTERRLLNMAQLIAPSHRAALRFGVDPVRDPRRPVRVATSAARRPEPRERIGLIFTDEIVLFPTRLVCVSARRILALRKGPNMIE